MLAQHHPVNSYQWWVVGGGQESSGLCSKQMGTSCPKECLSVLKIPGMCQVRQPIARGTGQLLLSRNQLQHPDSSPFKSPLPWCPCRNPSLHLHVV